MAEWPHFGKELIIRLTVCHLWFCLFVISAVSYFGFEGGTGVLIAPVDDHCLPFTFQENVKNKMWTSIITTFGHLNKRVDTVSRDGILKSMAKFDCRHRFKAMVRQFDDGMQERV